jgi:uncharacterized protein YkwD
VILKHGPDPADTVDVSARPRSLALHGVSPVRRNLAALLTAVMVTAPLFAPPAEAVTRDEASFAAMANGVRSNRDMRRLKVTERLSRLARKHSKQMATRGELYHSNLRRLFRGFDYRMVGENVGYGGSLDQLLEAFMDSPPHAANILGKWRKTGVGIVRRGDRIWITQLFYA